MCTRHLVWDETTINHYQMSHYLIVCSVFLSVGGEYVTIKSRSIANEITTGTIGATAVKEIKVHKTLFVDSNIWWCMVTGKGVIVWELTPTDKRYSNNVSGTDVHKHDDQFLVHVHSQCPHPHPRHQRKVVDQN